MSPSRDHEAAETVQYPGASERVVTLRNGTSIRLRPIRPDDAPCLIALCRRLSSRTVYQRFFTVRRLRPEDAHTLATFRADILAENRRALRLLVRDTDIVQQMVSDGVVSVVFQSRTPAND